jgi:hypothetical protein
MSQQVRKAARAARGTFLERTGAEWFDWVLRGGSARARRDEKRFTSRGRRRLDRAVVRGERDA